MPTPIPPPLVVTSPFGPRGAITLPDGTVKPPGFHAGVDLRAAVGTPLRAPLAGRVESIETGAAGLILRLRTSDGARWSFVHLADAFGPVGRSVAAGEVIGATGSSGGVAPHLHVERRAPGATSASDPLPDLRALEREDGSGAGGAPLLVALVIAKLTGAL